MSDKKHIDRLFQERFKDFEAAPSDAVWKNIEANLNNKKKKRRVIPIWWRYAGAAAVLLLLLTVGGLFTGNTPEDPLKVVDTETKNTTVNPEITSSNNASNSNNVVTKTDETKTVDDSQEASQSQKATQNGSNNSVVSKQETEVASTKSSYSKNRNDIKNDTNAKSNVNGNSSEIADNSKVNNPTRENSKNNVAAVNTSEENNKKETSITNTNNNNNAIAQIKEDVKAEDKDNEFAIAKNKEEQENLTIEEALEKDKEILKEDEKSKRWSLMANAAPVYFNTLGQGSSLDDQFVNNSKSGEVNMSYGVSASYALNDRIKIRSGVHRVNLGYNTNDVVVFQTAGVSVKSSIRNIKEPTTNGSNTVSDNVALSVASEASFSPVASLSSVSKNTTLNQAFSYIEVPMEIQYAVVNKKFGLNVIGGFSSFFLSDNSLSSESQNGSRILLGEVDNLNKISYSANFGLGLNYKFSKKLDFNLEPMLKYQINTFNNTSGNFTPIIIGVYTGFAIKF